MFGPYEAQPIQIHTRKPTLKVLDNNKEPMSVSNQGIVSEE